jgi:phytoene desaturase
MLHTRPGVMALVRAGAMFDAPFLLRSLGTVLERSGLPAEVRAAIAIWTHVAGQSLERAPSPMAFVPWLIHSVGPWYPEGGIGRIPDLLARRAAEAGVKLRYGTRVAVVRCERGRVVAVETADGERIAARAVLSDAGGVGTYLDLADATPPRFGANLRALPLQSPGVCAYLALRGTVEPPYLRFRLTEGRCEGLVLPSLVDPGAGGATFVPGRVLAPMEHADAERGLDVQRAYLDELLAQRWWRHGFDEVRVVATRTPRDWGVRHHLHRESMNPVMTAAFMRRGRIAHKSPVVDGLYLCGSATHPGQWVSFAAISGVLAADRLREDLGAR